jgi:hypothetical protein
MGDSTRDADIAAGFRVWIDLPADASPEQMWEARPSRVAVHRRLRAEPDPINFIETLLHSATDDHSMAVICEVIADLARRNHTATAHAIFERSDEEPWATLSLHVFGSGEFEGVPHPQINIAQAIEMYVWMGGELDPGETRDDRDTVGLLELEFALFDRAIDPIPLLQRVRRAAQTELEEDHVLTGVFESVCYSRPELRERVAAIAPTAWADFLRNL